MLVLTSRRREVATHFFVSERWPTMRSWFFLEFIHGATSWSNKQRLASDWIVKRDFFSFVCLCLESSNTWAVRHQERKFVRMILDEKYQYRIGETEEWARGRVITRNKNRGREKTMKGLVDVVKECTYLPSTQNVPHNDDWNNKYDQLYPNQLSISMAFVPVSNMCREPSATWRIRHRAMDTMTCHVSILLNPKWLLLNSPDFLLEIHSNNDNRYRSYFVRVSKNRRMVENDTKGSNSRVLWEPVFLSTFVMSDGSLTIKM